MIRYLFWIAVGFLSGSILYAYFIPKYINHVDICECSDDKNPGTANAFKYAGFWAGISVILCELLKAFFPVFFAARNVDTTKLPFAFIMAAPVAGHAFSIFFKGNGGKAIAASFGVLLALYPNTYPFAILAVLYIFFSTIIIITPHFYRSIITFILFITMVFFAVPTPSIRLGCGLIAGITILKHIMKFHGEAFGVHTLFSRHASE